MKGRYSVKKKELRKSNGKRGEKREEEIRRRRSQPVAQQAAAPPRMTEGDMAVAQFVAADESLRNLREGSERLNRELEEGRQTAWPYADVAAAQYVENPDNLMFVRAQPHYPMIDGNNRDVGLRYTEDQVMGQVIMDGNVPAVGNEQDQVVMAIPHVGGTKRRKSKKRKSKRRKSKKKMRRTKKYKR